MKKKLIIIALITILGISYLIFTPQRGETYSDELYHYTFQYDQKLIVTKSRPNSVTFSATPDDAWVIGVEVEDYNQSLEEWLEKNKKQKLEKEITLGGYKAIVTHYISEDGDIVSEKTTAVIKDGKMFKIFSRGTDHELIWRTWKFF